MRRATGLSIVTGLMALGVVLGTAGTAAAATPTDCKMWRVNPNGASISCGHVNGNRYRARVTCQRGAQPTYVVNGPYMTRDRAESTAFCATTADRVLYYNWTD